MCLMVRHISLTLIHGQSEAVHRSRAEVIAVFNATIPGIALHGVDQSVLHLFHDTDVIGQAVALPIKKDNVAGAWLLVSALPLTAFNEPVYIGTRALHLRQHSGIR